MNIGIIKSQIAGYLGQEVADFDINGQDLLLAGLNTTRRGVEKVRDFRYSETTASLSITANGGAFASVYISGATVTVTGTLSPNVTGSWTLQGVYNNAPFYAITVTGTQYLMFYTGSQWRIRVGFTGVDGWNLTTTSLNPAGSYTATGTSTGTATVAAANAIVEVKSIQDVQLPQAGGTYYSTEFMSQDELNARIRRQIGRQPYNPALTLTELGVSTDNPIAYQQGQIIYLYPPSSFTFPVTVQLNLIQFLPDYTSDTDSDFFVQNAPEFLLWQTILDNNKIFRQFVPRQQGNVDESAVAEYASNAMKALIQWDIDMRKGTSTPETVNQAQQNVNA